MEDLDAGLSHTFIKHVASSEHVSINQSDTEDMTMCDNQGCPLMLEVGLLTVKQRGSPEVMKHRDWSVFQNCDGERKKTLSRVDEDVTFEEQEAVNRSSWS